MVGGGSNASNEPREEITLNLLIFCEAAATAEEEEEEEEEEESTSRSRGRKGRRLDRTAWSRSM